MSQYTYTPGAQVALPDQPNLTQSLATAPVPQADMDRKRHIKDAWKAYRGDFQKPLKVERDQPDDNVIVNFSGPIVDKGASWLFGQPVKIEVVDDSGKDETPLQDFVNGFWGDDDDKMALLSDDAQNGGVCGHAFMKLIPSRGSMKYPRLVVLDPEIVRKVTAPDDCSLTLAYVIEYSYGATNNPGASVQKRQIIARVDPDGLAGDAGEYDLDDTWTIANYMRYTSATGQQGEWQMVGEVEEWPYPFPPIFDNKNLPNPNESWGTPDLTSDIIDQNKALNFLFSNLARIIKYHGHPKTWAKGVGAAQISAAVDDLIVLNSPDAQLGTLLPMENFAGILSVIAAVMSNIDQQSRVPAVALGRQDQLPKLGNISGIALSLMFQPLIEKTEQKRRLYGKTIREISRAALVLAGLLSIDDMEDCKIGLHWAPLLPADNLVAAQEALILQQLGISMQTILAGLGYDADDEADKKQAEDQKKVDMFAKGQGMPPAPPAPPMMQQPGQPPAQGQQGGEQQ